MSGLEVVAICLCVASAFVLGWSVGDAVARNSLRKALTRFSAANETASTAASNLAQSLREQP